MTDERALKLALQIVKEHYPEMPANYRGRRVQIALAAIKLTTKLAAEMADNEITRIFSTTTNGHGANTAKRIRDHLRAFSHLPSDGGENV